MKIMFQIKNDSLLALDIPIIYRIIEKYQLKYEINNEITDFLFKYFDKKGRKASILLSFIDINKIDIVHLKRLMSYSDVLDFHFLNSSLTKTLYEMMNQMILREKQIRIQDDKQMKIINFEIEQLKKELQEVKDQNKKLYNDQKINKENHEKLIIKN